MRRSHRMQLHLAGKIVTARRARDGPGESRVRAPAHTLPDRAAQDIANAAVFLASDRATFMTGSNLVWTRMVGGLTRVQPDLELAASLFEA